jgi:hypothetical protein
MKSLSYILIVALFAFVASCKAQQNITECLELAQEVNRFSFNESDFTPTDSLIDLKNGYFEMSSSDHVLTQAAKFNKKDKSTLLLVSGFYSDMQCANFPFYLFEIDKKGDTCIKKDPMNFFPALRYEDFLKNDSVLKIANKYLPILAETYLDENATVQQILSEFYDFHFILPRFGTTIEVTLTVCDYIPVNEQEIVEWKEVEKAIKSLYFKFNKQSGLFELVSKKTVSP